jgi:hypothetical protein
MSKIMSAFAFATLLSLPAFAAVPSSTVDQDGLARLGVSESIPAKVVEDTSKVQEPRVRVAPRGCATSCTDMDDIWEW